MSIKRYFLLVIIGFAYLASLPVLAVPKDNIKPVLVPNAINAAKVIIIRGGNIAIKVPDYQVGRVSVMDIASKYGAKLRDAKTLVNYVGKKSGQLSLTVDADKLDDMTNDIRGIGKLYSEKLQSNDQTPYYEKLKRRTFLLRQSESELMNFLRSPRHMRGSDILFVQSRLFQTRAEFSDADQEIIDLERGALRGALNITLFEPDAGPSFNWRNWKAYAAGKAKTKFFTFVQKLCMGGYYTLWFAPFWLPMLILLWLIVQFIRRKFLKWRMQNTKTVVVQPEIPKE